MTIDTTSHRLYPAVPANSTRRPFLTPLPDLPGEFLLVLDNTSLDKVKRCHKAAQNYLVLGREAQVKTAALVFGGAIHEGLELFHKQQYFDWQVASPGWAEENYGPKLQDKAIRQHFLNHPLPPEILQYDYRTEAAALEVLAHYRNRSDVMLHPDYEWKILSDVKGPIVERPFELPLGVLEFDNWEILPPDCDKPVHYNKVIIHVAWSGRIDLLVEQNARASVGDHKTSSIDTPDYFRQFELSSQVRGYVWAASKLWPEHSPRSFIHNGIFLKKPNKDQGLLTPGTRGGKPPLYFQRTHYPTNSESAYSDSAIARWERDTLLQIEDFLHSVSRSVFPLNDNSCVQKFGICEYHDCCRMDDEARAHNYLMSSAYKTVSWNPTA